MTSKLSKIAYNALFLAGIGVFLYGCWTFWHPAAFLVAGAVIAVIGFLGGVDPIRSWHDGEDD